MAANYKLGIERVWAKAKSNAFYRGVPFIWCSNNLTTSFAIQCLQYAAITKSHVYDEFAQANIDWLFGCNPWGTSMVYGLPAHGDTPVHPHSAFTELYNYPINGGLVDGPVYGNIFKGLKGVKLAGEDPYADYQSGLAVYHDDYFDYSTNEPTMDGTAALVYLLAAKENEARTVALKKKVVFDRYGAIIRGDTTGREIALVFTGHEFADGGSFIANTLREKRIKASFFLTGAFYRNKDFAGLIRTLLKQGNYMGAHGDQHLLYADWGKRDSTLVSERQFKGDLEANYGAMQAFGITKQAAHYFLPAFEWYNADIVRWTADLGLQLVNFTPGTRSAADYTFPEMGKGYLGAERIYENILQYEGSRHMRGFMLISHIGTDKRRTDKFYRLLPLLIDDLKGNGYKFVTLKDMLD